MDKESIRKNEVKMEPSGSHLSAGTPESLNSNSSLNHSETYPPQKVRLSNYKESVCDGGN